jgi:hypothetical protein
MKDFDFVNIYREIVPWIHLAPVQTQIYELQGHPKVKRNLFCEFVLVQALHLNLFWSFQLKRNVLVVVVRKIVADYAICNS